MKQNVGFFKRLYRSIESICATLKITFQYAIGKSEGFKEATEEYPDRVSARMPEDLPARYRGFLTNDIEKCSGCKYCVEACPVDCIHIDTEPGPRTSQSWVAVFDIDLFKCMFCGLCVDVCPTKSLVHTKEYQGSAFHLDELVLSYGRGWATPKMKEQWLAKQKEKESRLEEELLYEQKPVSAELMNFKAKSGEDPEGGDK